MGAKHVHAHGARSARGSVANPEHALKAAGLKRTKSREALLRHLMRHHGPFSAKDLHVALKEEGSDAVTTYRCLTAFEEAGLVRRCEFGDGTARFEYSGEGSHHHHHVICTECRKIESVEICGVAGWETRVRQLGYSRVQHVLEFRGICRDCQPGR